MAGGMPDTLGTCRRVCLGTFILSTLSGRKAIMFSQIPLFESLSEQELEAITRHAVTKGYKRSTVVISKGDHTDSLYVILSGKVKVFLSDDSGKEYVLTTLGPGEYFGEMALLDTEPRSASIVTLEPSRFSIISRQDFLHHLADHPEIALKLLTQLTMRLRQMIENAGSLALLDVYGRVARVLLQTAEEDPEGRTITERLTQQEIANRVGASREMVSRILRDLKTGGYIDTDDHHIIINRKLPPAW
jgi:CRP/FNR family cyclic AMP-dependent transcriptional regulator